MSIFISGSRDSIIDYLREKIGQGEYPVQPIIVESVINQVNLANNNIKFHSRYYQCCYDQALEVIDNTLKKFNLPTTFENRRECAQKFIADKDDFIKWLKNKETDYLIDDDDDNCL